MIKSSDIRGEDIHNRVELEHPKAEDPALTPSLIHLSIGPFFLAFSVFISSTTPTTAA